ncbi:MAG: dTMP kinase [Verrucomicrobia bacterium]|nr:MAG: dTMP kinase [Verrucomicrobiota bacterium]
MPGFFITFEGTEGGGKSTQIALLAERLKKTGRVVRLAREPGGTPIGEEIRHTLMHSKQNDAMSAETELLLMNASRAQLVREVIRPALFREEIVLCDRFYDSTVAYQGYGRELDLNVVRTIIDYAVGNTRPALTLLLCIPIEVSEARRLARQAGLCAVNAKTGKKTGRVPLTFSEPLRDRLEESDRKFFERVEQGYQQIAAAEPARVKVIDGTASVDAVSAAIWREVKQVVRANA